MPKSSYQNVKYSCVKNFEKNLSFRSRIILMMYAPKRFLNESSENGRMELFPGIQANR